MNRFYQKQRKLFKLLKTGLITLLLFITSNKSVYAIDFDKFKAEWGFIFDPGSFLAAIRNVLVPLAIVIGIILALLAGFKIMMSEGNPEKIKKGREDLTSAIIGLIFVVFSIAILRVIIESLIGVEVD